MRPGPNAQPLRNTNRPSGAKAAPGAGRGSASARGLRLHARVLERKIPYHIYWHELYPSPCALQIERNGVDAPCAAWPSALKPALGGKYKKSGNPHELTHPVRRQCGAGRPRSSWRWVAQGRDAQWRQSSDAAQTRRQWNGSASYAVPHSMGCFRPSVI